MSINNVKPHVQRFLDRAKTVQKQARAAEASGDTFHANLHFYYLMGMGNAAVFCGEDVASQYVQELIDELLADHEVDNVL